MARRLAGLAALSLLATGCGTASVTASSQTDQRFLGALYGQAPDISTYRTSRQLISLGQAVCADLGSGASVQDVGDRIPLVEGNVVLPPADLGAVISAAVGVLCPKFRSLIGS